MIIYTTILIIGVWFSYLAEQSKKKRYVLLIALIFALFAGLRANSVGLDTKTYGDIFDALLTRKSTQDYRIEGSFLFICKKLLIVFPHENYLFFLFAFLTHWCILIRLWDFREQCSFSIMVFCYFCAFYFVSLNGLRQYCAVSIVFFATRFLLKGNYIKFLICIFFATLFHKTALLGMGFLFCELFFVKYLKHQQKWFLLTILMIVCLFSVVLFPKIWEEYAHYFDEVDIDIGFMLFFKCFFLVFTFACLQKKYSSCLYQNEQSQCLFKRIGLYYLLGICLTFFGYIFLYLDRLGAYYSIFECVYMGLVVKQLKFGKYAIGSLLLKCFVIALFVYIFVNSMLGNAQGQMPYMFFWELKEG